MAVLLNVAPDHLDWHGSFEEYAATKARVFAYQRDRDRLVFNGDDEVVGLIGRPRGASAARNVEPDAVLKAGPNGRTLDHG